MTTTSAPTSAIAPTLCCAPRSLYARVLKRFLDLLASTILLVLLLPLMAFVAAAVRLFLGAPVFYREARAGLHGHPIQIVKFRSMRESTAADGSSLSDADRLSLFGRVLRQTSLDELPQLLSVLRGDMSMVGPRPLPLRYVSRYSPRQAARLLVRPGLTGWAQIHGRNAVDWPRRLEYDAHYVEMLGRITAPLTDLWIVLVTIIQILWQAVTGRGIAAPGAATMQEFAP